MANTMIERVALAISQMTGHDVDPLEISQEAIEAMREPNAAVIKAMSDNIGPLSAMWQCGIDAILNEGLDGNDE